MFFGDALKLVSKEVLCHIVYIYCIYTWQTSWQQNAPRDEISRSAGEPRGIPSHVGRASAHPRDVRASCQRRPPLWPCICPPPGRPARFKTTRTASAIAEDPRRTHRLLENFLQEPGRPQAWTKPAERDPVNAAHAAMPAKNQHKSIASHDAADSACAI